MFILPINRNIVQQRLMSFSSGIEKTASVLPSISKVLNNKKEIGIMTGLAAAGAATSLLLKSYIENKPSKNLNHPVVQMIKAEPLRVRYIEMLHDFPKLSDKYYEMLERASKNEEIDISKDILNIFEVILGGFAKPEAFEKNKYRLQTLEDNYSEDLDNICINLYNNGKNGGSIYDYLNQLNDKSFSSKDLEDWTKYPGFTSDEYIMLKGMPKKLKKLLNNFKIEGKVKHFKIENVKNDDDSYFFKLTFSKETPIEDRKKMIIRTHEAIYGPIPSQNEISKSGYRVEDVESELYARLQKDKILDALYNLLKYLNPKVLAKYDYTSRQVKYLDRESDEYKRLRKDIGAAIIDINFHKSPRINELVEVMNTKELYDGIMDNNHAILRVISRIVLKDNFNANLKTDAEVFIKKLNEEIKKKLERVVPCFRYRYNKGYAPSFYLGKTDLGDYLKITLNNEGKIHTIFEDIRYTKPAGVFSEKKSKPQT